MQPFQLLRTVRGSVLAAIIGLTTLPWTDAYAACGATVNGAPMTAEQCQYAMQKYGYVEPGHYWMDGNGTWGRVGDPRPQGNIYSGDYRSRDGLYGGSGGRSGNGSWHHYQDQLLGGGYVGGDGNCIYTENWSNC